MERLEMNIEIKCPDFPSAKAMHRYVKTIITQLDRQFNAHTLDRGDWPLVIQADRNAPVGCLNLRFVKELEPEENPKQTMDQILSYIKNMQVEISSTNYTGSLQCKHRIDDAINL